jgi:dihydrofolate reductase
MINIIAAVSQNSVIGRDGKLPWYYPADIRWFARQTSGGTIVMGRKTFESIDNRPLPNRHNIVVSKTADIESVEVCRDLEKFLNTWTPVNMGEDIWIIGGAEIYKLALPYAHRLYLTAIPEIVVDGKLTFFPDWQMEEFECVRWEQNFNDPRLYHSVYQRRGHHKG